MRISGDVSVKMRGRHVVAVRVALQPLAAVREARALLARPISMYSKFLASCRSSTTGPISVPGLSASSITSVFMRSIIACDEPVVNPLRSR